MMNIKDFPEEIVERMLHYQEVQGNKRDIKVFEKRISANAIEGGFTWEDTPEGDVFWAFIFSGDDFNLYFEKYPKKYTYPKIMYVSDSPITKDMKNYSNLLKRVVVVKNSNGYLAWNEITTFEEVYYGKSTTMWPYAVDVEIVEQWKKEKKEKKEIKEFTLEDISKLSGIPIERIRIKK